MAHKKQGIGYLAVQPASLQLCVAAAAKSLNYHQSGNRNAIILSFDLNSGNTATSETDLQTQNRKNIQNTKNVLKHCNRKTI